MSEKEYKIKRDIKFRENIVAEVPFLQDIRENETCDVDSVASENNATEELHGIKNAVLFKRRIHLNENVIGEVPVISPKRALPTLTIPENINDITEEPTVKSPEIEFDEIYESLTNTPNDIDSDINKDDVKIDPAVVEVKFEEIVQSYENKQRPISPDALNGSKQSKIPIFRQLSETGTRILSRAPRRRSIDNKEFKDNVQSKIKTFESIEKIDNQIDKKNEEGIIHYEYVKVVNDDNESAGAVENKEESILIKEPLHLTEKSSDRRPVLAKFLNILKKNEKDQNTIEIKDVTDVRRKAKSGIPLLKKSNMTENSNDIEIEIKPISFPVHHTSKSETNVDKDSFILIKDKFNFVTPKTKVIKEDINKNIKPIIVQEQAKISQTENVSNVTDDAVNEKVLVISNQDIKYLNPKTEHLKHKEKPKYNEEKGFKPVLSKNALFEDRKKLTHKPNFQKTLETESNQEYNEDIFDDIIVKDDNTNEIIEEYLSNPTTKDEDIRLDIAEAEDDVAANINEAHNVNVNVGEIRQKSILLNLNGDTLSDTLDPMQQNLNDSKEETHKKGLAKPIRDINTSEKHKNKSEKDIKIKSYEKVNESDKNILKSDDAIQSKKDKLEKNQIKADKDIIKSDKDILRSDKNITKKVKDLNKFTNEIIKSDKFKIKSHKNIMQSDIDIMHSDKDIIKSEKSIIKADNDINKSDNVIVVSDQNKIKSDKNITKSYQNIVESYKNIIKSEKPIVKRPLAIFTSKPTEEATITLIRTKSLADIELGTKIKGKVELAIRELSVDKVFEKPVGIKMKERPRRNSVSEKIALFEKKITPVPMDDLLLNEEEKLKKAQGTPLIGLNDEDLEPGKTPPKFEAEEQRKQHMIDRLINAKEELMPYEKYDIMPFYMMRDGNKMPVIALGTALLLPDLTKYVVAAAIDLGYRAIDTAYIYGNEREVGEGIQMKIDDGTIKREDIFVISKLWNTYHAPQLVETACRESLQTLGLEYVDLYLIHQPMSFKEGPDPTPMVDNKMQYSEQHDFVDAWKAMMELKRRHLVRSIGVSNFNVEQLQTLINKTGETPAVNQIECHPYLTQRTLSDFCAANHIAISAYSVLGSKGTPAEYKSSNATAVLDDPTVMGLAKRSGLSPTQILLRYQLERGHCLVVKSSTPEHLLMNLSCLNMKLNKQQVALLDQLNRDQRNFDFRGMGDTHKNYPFHAFE